MRTGEFKVTFQGGDKFKGVLAKISAQAVGVRAGILEGATKPDGTPIPPYAAVNEFGGKSVHNGKVVTIPARPFMRDSVRLHSGEWGRALSTKMAGHPDGAKAAMYIVGQRMQADIKATIAAGNFTPLSDGHSAETQRDPGRPRTRGARRNEPEYSAVLFLRGDIPARRHRAAFCAEWRHDPAQRWHVVACNRRA